MSASKPAPNVLSQLSNVLPTGTFLVFQILAPLATNNGNCGHVEVVLTITTLSLLCLLCVTSAFSDSCEVDGVVHYGLVTHWGLYNPNFKRVIKGNDKSSFWKGKNKEYIWEMDDFVSAAVSVLALATISLLTAPVTTCFYPNIKDSILKTVPVLVAVVVSVVCAFGNTPRHGLGLATAPKTEKPKTDEHETDEDKTDEDKTDKHKTDKHKIHKHKTEAPTHGGETTSHASESASMQSPTQKGDQSQV